MSSFNEANTTEQFIIDLLTQPSAVSPVPAPATPSLLLPDPASGTGAFLTDLRVREASGDWNAATVVATLQPQWEFVKASNLGRKETEVLVEPIVRQALINLNPEIQVDPAKADEVLYHLNAILLEGKTNLIQANEHLMEWLRGEKSMPFGANHEYVPVKLIDFEHPQRNRFVITQQYTYKPDTHTEKRMDLELLVNSFPLVIGEVKTPVRPSVSWVDGVKDFIDDYWKTVPALFVPNVCCFASEGKTYRYATLGSDYLQWAPWRETRDRSPNLFAELGKAVVGMLNPATVLDLLISFSVFPVNRQGRKAKVIARYPQYEAAQQIVQRVVEGRIKRGLIWHFQGSGKSLLMVFAAMLLKANPALKNPTVIVVVDRKDLNTQIGATFDAVDVPNTVKADTGEKLEQLLIQGSRQIIITTVHKFADIPANANTSDNVIVLVDEAHRTQEGDLGRKMRAALPNAFLFGLTGTPIARRDRNTFAWFGAEEDPDGYLNRYSYQQAVFDEAILPVHFVPRPVQLGIDQAAIDAGFEEIAAAAELDTTEKAELSKRGGRLSHLLAAPVRITAVADHITQHFQEPLEPSGFKGMVVMIDRPACVMMYYLLVQRLGTDAIEVVMITQDSDLADWQDGPAFKQNNITVQETDYQRWKKADKDQTGAILEKLLNRYRDPSDPLKLLVVTNKLLTGFDASICKAMYLNKPLRDHTLLQAICRTNRLYPNKYNGLILDYLGVFDEPQKALDFDLQQIKGAIAPFKP
jgi:type I restriction enzyme R subunit